VRLRTLDCLPAENQFMLADVGSAGGLHKRFWAKPAHTEIVEERDVPVQPLDIALIAHELTIDAIKIDVYGGELDYLHGTSQALRNGVITAEIEVSFIDRHESQPLFCDLHSLMTQAGFELIDLLRLKRYRHVNAQDIDDPWQGHGKRTGRIAFCNALYLPHHDHLLAMTANPATLSKPFCC
jgi:hypothetical protein